MANRHKMQARARGGRTGFAGGGEVYAGKGSNVEKEAKEKKFGGAVVGRAFGGGVKGRADKRKRGGGIKAAFAQGGKVWSKARGGIGGTKGFADEVMKVGKQHDEMHDNTTKTAGDGNHTRTGRSGKAKHQLATGGRVPKARGGECEKEEAGDKEDDPGYAYGGPVTYKRGGKLKMHYVGGKGRHHRADGGRLDEPDADADDKKMAKGGGCWMAKAFAKNKGAFTAKAEKAGMSTGAYAKKEAASPSASTKTKRQANLAKIGAEYGGG